MMSCSGTMAEMDVEEEEGELLLKLADACADDVVEDDADVDAEEAVVDIEEAEDEDEEGEEAAAAPSAAAAGAVAAAAAGCCGMGCGAAVAAASVSSGIVIHGWQRISSMRMRSPGLIRRHRFIRSWHWWVSRVRNLISAEQICSSCSKGMSPQTMSNRRMPSDHTVAGFPW